MTAWTVLNEGTDVLKMANCGMIVCQALTVAVEITPAVRIGIVIATTTKTVMTTDITNDGSTGNIAVVTEVDRAIAETRVEEEVVLVIAKVGTITETTTKDIDIVIKRRNPVIVHAIIDAETRSIRARNKVAVTTLLTKVDIRNNKVVPTLQIIPQCHTHTLLMLKDMWIQIPGNHRHQELLRPQRTQNLLAMTMMTSGMRTTWTQLKISNNNRLHRRLRPQKAVAPKTKTSKRKKTTNRTLIWILE